VGKYANPEGQDEQGNRHVECDRRKNESFDVRAQIDIARMLYGLQFSRGKRITREGEEIGRQLQQSKRRLTDANTEILSNYIEGLKKG